jgi:hypothetical protein
VRDTRGGTQQQSAVDFSPEQLLRYARGNAAAWALGTIAFLRALGLPVEAWTEYLGRQFAAQWRTHRALKVARGAALDLVATGGELLEVAGDDDRAEAVVAGWPPAELVELFGLSPAGADAFLDVFAPIAAELEMDYTWRREGDAVRLTFARGRRAE